MRLLDLLRDGIEVIDLAQPFEDGMPSSPTHPGFRFALRERHGDVVRPGGLTGSHELLTMGGHVGTHMDALCHVAVDGHLFGGVAVADALAGGRYRTHGIDQVAPLVRRGVLFDVPRHRGRDRLAAGDPVGVDDLLASGPPPAPGDVALIRTGWASLWSDPAAYVGDERGVPGVDVDAARWLAGRGVTAVAADTLVLEHVPAGKEPSSLPVHRVLLTEHGINLVEAMNLETLAARGVGEFLFVGAPLNIVGATGAPIRPLALLST